VSVSASALLPDVENRTVLIEGVLFRTRYLGSTKIASECNPSKARRMLQAQEAVGQIKVRRTFYHTFFLLCLRPQPAGTARCIMFFCHLFVDAYFYFRRVNKPYKLIKFYLNLWMGFWQSLLPSLGRFSKGSYRTTNFPISMTILVSTGSVSDAVASLCEFCCVKE